MQCQRVDQWWSFGSAICERWFDLQWRKSRYTLLMTLNEVETAIQRFCISHTVLTGFSWQFKIIIKFLSSWIKLHLIYFCMIKWDKMRIHTSCSYVSTLGGCVEANVLNCDIVVSEFELQSCYYVHFRTNALPKGINPPYPSAVD